MSMPQRTEHPQAPRRVRGFPGRLRAEIKGLRGNPRLARRAVRVISALAGVRHVEANPLTGRALVLYDVGLVSPRAVLDLVRTLDATGRARAPRAGVRPVQARPDASRNRALFLAKALQPVVASALLVGLGLKLVFRGYGPRAQSERLNALSVLVSGLTGYPQMRRLTRRAFGRRTPDIVGGYLGIAIKAYRESLLGLTTEAGSHLFEYLEISELRRARRHLSRLLHHTGYAHLRLNDGREMEIPVSELQPGELIRLEGGHRVPADGVIDGGTGLVDESVLSNRAFLSRKIPGDTVYLGTRLRQGTLLVRVTATGTESRLGQVLHRAPGQRAGTLPVAAMRAARRMGAAGLGLTAMTFVLSRSWRRALAVLAVLNPSPILYSAIAASGAAMEAAAREHVRVQRRGAFDVLAHVDVVLFGKTGTLTAEFPAVDAVVPMEGARGDMVLALSASALRYSNHPLAFPFLEKALELGVGLLPVSDVQITPAHLVQARVGDATVSIGGARPMGEAGISLDTAQEAERRIEAQGNEVLFVARDGRVIGVIALRERLLPGAREAVAGLRACGIVEIGVLSGDPTQSAARLAAELGIQRVWSGVDDEEKRSIVRQLQREGRVVAVVGASASDILAMAQADVAVGFSGAGWTPTPQTAHIMLLHGRLDVLPGLVRLSRGLQEVYRQNLTAASAVSAAAAAGAFLGLLPFSLADEVNHYLTLALLANARRLSLVRLGESPAESLDRTPGPPWHALAPRDVAQMLATDAETGLSGAEAERRLRRYGANALAETAPPSLGALYVRQLATGMTVLLGAAAVGSVFIAEPLNAGLIAGIVLVNAGLGAVQERRAERAVAALRQSTAPTARCRRGGELQQVPATRLVPGDMIVLQAGDTVPADARLIESYELEVEEAMLTGESQPATKGVAPVRVEVELPDRTSMIYMGSAVTSGRARAIVVATGMATAVGQIAGLLDDDGEGKTPLQTRLFNVSRNLAGLSVLAGAGFVGIGVVRRLPLPALVLGGISLVTAAVPEGLPAIVTIALSTAVQRMSRQSLVVRRLTAVETLGRVTVICCDKTGTLTQNRMAVRALATGRLEWTGEEFAAASIDSDARQALIIGAVCNDATVVDLGARVTLGGSTEGGLLLAAADAGLDPTDLRRDYPRVTELPFSTDRGFMAVVVRDPNLGLVLMLKGAPETIIEFCDRRRLDSAIAPLDATLSEAALSVSDRMAYEAMRVLALAYQPLERVPPSEALEQPRGCIFAGLIGQSDPLRPEVRDAVQRCGRAGVRVVMATGDHRSTAIAVARQLGLVFAREGVLEGPQLEAITDNELAALLPRTQVFARVTPAQKLRIVKAMQAGGDVVAMTGDGVNDAPAVKRADVGIAMGHTGTEVTRQASSIVLGDDSFVSIVRAIEEGRGVQRNLRRSLGFLLGGNLGETLFVLSATLLTGDVPLLPLHLLLVNLFTDALPVMALAGLPSRPDRFGPPNRGNIFDRPFYNDVVRRGLVTAIAATTIHSFGRRGAPGADRSVALAGLVASQLVQAQNWGSGEPADRFFYASLGVSWAALAAVMTLSPLQRLFGTVSLSPLMWAQIMGISIAADRLLRTPSIVPALPTLSRVRNDKPTP